MFLGHEVQRARGWGVGLLRALSETPKYVYSMFQNTFQTMFPGLLNVRACYARELSHMIGLLQL